MTYGPLRAKSLEKRIQRLEHIEEVAESPPLACVVVYDTETGYPVRPIDWRCELQAWATDETWRLFILNEDGQMLAPSQGLLFGYELALDMSGWFRLHYITLPLLWPSYHVWPNGTVEISPDSLVWIAESSEAFVPQHQAEADAFRELMAEFEWNLED
jgi:hypothetical protein